MYPSGTVARPQRSITRISRTAAGAVLVVAALNWVGWAGDIDQLVRIHPGWPRMTPWTALWLATLAVAVILQTGVPSRRRVRGGQVLAIVTGTIAAVILAEHLTGKSFALDRLWFGDAVLVMTRSEPGRPNLQTAVTVVLLAAAIGFVRVQHPWAQLVWPATMIGATVIPVVTVGAYLFDANVLDNYRPATGQALPTAVGLILLICATLVTSPERFPLPWLLARPNSQAVLRLFGVLIGFPVVVAMSQLALRGSGLGQQAAWVVSIAVGTAAVAVGTFYLSQREQRLRAEKQAVDDERAMAQERYRILADNAVDVILQLRGTRIVWASPSTEAAFGGALETWIGSDITARVHEADLPAMSDVLIRIGRGEAVRHRFRFRTDTGGYHWVEGHGKPYVDGSGSADGLIAALRIIDAQVEAEERLQRMARFDALTGLANRGEAIERLELALQFPETHGGQLGVLFCDVDDFKDINDTWGHAMGDAVLTTLATRIVECVRSQDTVGRTGGDEILVLLPGVQSVAEAAQVAEKIRSRAGEPIQESGVTIRATLSIGATVAFPGERVAEITKRADAAMYQAKLHHKNRVTPIEAERS